MPAGDRVGLDVQQRTPPTGPPLAESDPEYPIKGCQNRSPPFPLEGRELQSQCRVLENHGLLTAHQQADESKEAQQNGCHVFRFFRSIPL
jgi:hypothetical protein